MLTLEDRPGREGADRNTGEQRGEKEVVPRAHDNLKTTSPLRATAHICANTHDIVVRRVEGVKKAGGAPAAAADDEGLLGGIVGELLAGRAVLLGVVVERCAAGDGDEGDGARDLEEPLPEGGPDGGRGLDVL